MTESAWLALTRTSPLKGFAFHHPKATERRRMLSACACCRLAQDWGLPDLEADMLDATERHTDGAITRRTWLKRLEALEAHDAGRERNASAWDRAFRRVVASLFYPTPYWGAPSDLISAVAGVSSPKYAESLEIKFCSAVRDIFGDLFRDVSLAPGWRTDTAITLARQMYESREFSAMPILADALQDAGCDSDHVLSHCRDPHQVHVRGCWVVDLVLGKS